jgi:predicted AlkP superfamily phosphohydrolase/phosphomutase
MTRIQKLLLVVLLALAASSCLDNVFETSAEETERKEPEQPAKWEPGPLMIIGADGLDLEVIRPLAEQGRLPNIVNLMEHGCHGILLSEREMRSPPLWTTIATGRPRSKHGIYDFVTGSRLWPEKLRKVKRKLVTSKMRKVPALWNVASDAGLKVATVGWLNTWPAEKINGVMVAPFVALGTSKQITIKGGLYRDERKQVSPPGRWEEILPLIIEAEDVPDKLVAAFASAPGGVIAKKYPILERYMGGLRWSLAHTLTMKNITLHLLKNDSPDLTMVYFEGSDSLAHRFWLFRQPHRQIAAQLAEAGYSTRHVGELAEKYGKVVDTYYVLLDEVIGELVAALGPGGRVILLSDHGFCTRSGQYPLSKAVPFTGEHRIEGTLVISGPGIRSGKRIYGATHYNITPTVLDLLGVKTDLRMEGNSLFPQIEDKEDYEELIVEQGILLDAEKDDEDSVPFGEAEIERLRSLGYVE